MSPTQLRSAAAVLVLAIAVIAAAAHRGPVDSAAAGAAGAGPAKTVEVPGPFVPADAGPSMPEVDSLGTRHLTGRAGKTVALTFDDGPHPGQTPQVLRILRDYDVTATFCVVEPNVRRHQDLVREIVADGHTLCNHTVSHDSRLPERPAGRIDDEIGTVVRAIDDVVPEAAVPFFRAPGGNFAANVNAVADGYGEQPLGWSIDPEDWRDQTTRRIRDEVIQRMHPGAVVLLHDGGGDRSATIAALPRIIETVRAAGYEFVVPRA
ncbi:peptidoglycan/xylan/chitin deacetylase (PgdA/CDA1 family) [Haloactinopolyspora alba]|uniref:Peptidoglycan/xylan/chitin deacetylase (PgdA/CDA1 family) n=1 Tax=Haloactinopolyspora alba TaxID=648780 RepID=A0A2P8E298_9ACTN|nr:polysaccharide deacetylase family protein [Haloactinopolyspora alba]PSL03579.1 peptidoglycan/xylan/chitin deacetylase (PgdA/CDA1 family) [Haloactinopolyspora alba]